MKKELWEAYYTAKAEGASREVTNAIIDVMVIADKEAAGKKLEKIEVSSWQTPISMLYLRHNEKGTGAIARVKSHWIPQQHFTEGFRYG